MNLLKEVYKIYSKKKFDKKKFYFKKDKRIKNCLDN